MQSLYRAAITQLGVAHTHLLALEKVFAVSRNQKLFTSFFWIHNLGHIFITIALAIFVTALGRSIKTVEA